MAYIAQPVTDDPDEPRCVYCRPTPDLSDHILGTVFWVNQDDNHPYPGYYRYTEEEDKFLPVESVNNYWWNLHFRPYNQTYWTSKDDRYDPYQGTTGYWNLTDPEHPEYQAEPRPSQVTLTVPRRRASTVGELESPLRFADNPDLDNESYEGETTLVDSQQHTAVPPTPQEREEELEADILAAQLQYGLDIQDRDLENPVDSDYPHYQQIIAGAIILGQDVPALPPLADPEPDPEDPPIPTAIQGHQAIVAFLPSGTPAPTPVPALVMAHQQAGDAKLCGLPPALFDGNCKKSEDFLREFQLFRGLNENHELMTNPYFQSMLALSYM